MKNKYYKQEKQVSYNNGLTWEGLGEYRQGDLYETDALDCKTSQPKAYTLYLSISDQYSTKTVECYNSVLVSGDMIGSFQFETKERVYEVIIGDCVTVIEGAFNSFSALHYVIIPNSVSAITDGSFYGCGSLPSIEIPSSVTTIGNNVFYECTSLTNITIPNGVTSIGSGVFDRCLNLTSVSLPSGITSISSSAFRECSSLTNIDIPSGVTSIGNNAFEYCFSLSSITIPSGVTSIGNRAFKDCNNLTSVTCLAATPPTLGENAFYQYPPSRDDCPIYVPCESLIAYKTAENWSTYGNRIQGIPPCVAPTPSGATKIQTSYSNGDFYYKYCDDSTELSVNDTKPSGYQYSAMTSVIIGDCVTSISNNAFYGCTSLPSVDIPSGITSISVNAFYDCTSLTSVNIPSGITSIGEKAFYRCSGLTSIDMPNSVTSIGGYAFYKCSGLTSIIVNATTPPNLGRYAFDNTNDCPIYVPCQSILTYQTTTNWSDYASRIQGIPPCDIVPFKFSATYIGGQTYSAACDSSSYITTADTRPRGYQYSAMTSAEVGECVTNIRENAFNSFGNITNIILDNGVEEIGMYAFRGCSSLISITLPPSLTTLNEGVFYGCTSLPTVDIPNGITGIPYGLFSGCTSLSTITIPSGVTVISTYAFRYCSSLSALVIPNGVNVIGQYAFDGCSTMTSCTIGSGVTSIGQFAFLNCSGLTSITCLAPTPPSIDSYMFNTTNNCPIYVLASSLETYKTAQYWSTYADRIQPIT